MKSLLQTNGVINDIIQYAGSNWLSIVVTIVLTLVGVVGTQRYIRKEVTSARKERHTQAKENLLNILETQIVNNKQISSRTVNNLIDAMDRKYSVKLSDNVTEITILQDLQLRISESRHLDASQKQEYTELIEDEVRSIKEESESPDIQKEKKEIIDEIRYEIREGTDSDALYYLDNLEEKLSSENIYQEPVTISAVRLVADPREGISVLSEYPLQRQLRVIIVTIIFIIAYFSVIATITSFL